MEVVVMMITSPFHLYSCGVNQLHFLVNQLINLGVCEIISSSFEDVSVCVINMCTCSSGLLLTVFFLPGIKVGGLTKYVLGRAFTSITKKVFSSDNYV